MNCPFNPVDPCENPEIVEIPNYLLGRSATTLINSNFQALMCLLGPKAELVDLGEVPAGQTVNDDLSKYITAGLDPNLTVTLGPQDPDCGPVTVNPDNTFSVLV